MLMAKRLVAVVSWAGALLLSGASVRAAGRSPARDRDWEPEVHLAAGAGDPADAAGGYGAGLGARMTFTLGSFGVSAAVPDWIGLGVGLELMRHAAGGSPLGTCVERTPAPAGTSVCTRVDAPGSSSGYVLLPVVARWALGVTPTLALFVEPGVGVAFSGNGAGGGPLLALGGQLRLGDAASAVLRIGWPVSTLGISF
jgi:hypothetical protein